MSSRETVIEFISKLPEDLSLAEIAREVDLLAGLHAARDQAERGDGTTAEEARRLVISWAPGAAARERSAANFLPWLEISGFETGERRISWIAMPS